jgi:uncharacterized protein YciI
MDRKHYIYVLRLIPRLLEPANWRQEDNDIVDEHFRHLQKRLLEGTLILAGKTEGLDKDTFGIVIIAAENERQAIQAMQNDPAVLKGIMTASLYPFKVALIQKADGVT